MHPPYSTQKAEFLIPSTSEVFQPQIFPSQWKHDYLLSGTNPKPRSYPGFFPFLPAFSPLSASLVGFTSKMCPNSTTSLHLLCSSKPPSFLHKMWSELCYSVAWIPAQVPYPCHDSLRGLLGPFLVWLYSPPPSLCSSHTFYSWNTPTVFLPQVHCTAWNVFYLAFAWLSLSICIGISSSITFLEKLSFTIPSKYYSGVVSS